MNILYVSQFYYPENIAGAFRATEHSSYWSAWGNKVTVFTGWPNYPTRKLFPGYTMKLFEESYVNEVRVLRSKELIGANTSFAKRAVNMASFYGYGLLNYATKKKVIDAGYDVVFASSGPVFAALLGLRIARKLHKPFVVEFRDLTYIQVIATGSKPESPKVSAVKGLELMLCKHAEAIIVVTNGLKESLVAEGIPEEKISVVPNGADVVDTQRSFEWAEVRLGYFGTIGLSQDVMQVAECISRLVESGLDIGLTIIGEGADRESIEEFAERGNAAWLTLMRGISKDELEPYYQSVDMTVVALLNSPEFESSIPSKIFQSLARGVPVIFFGPEGEASQLIEANEVGITLCSSPDENAEKLTGFVTRPDCRSEMARMGRNAISLMERKFSRKRMAEKAINVIEKAVHRSVATRNV